MAEEKKLELERLRGLDRTLATIGFPSLFGHKVATFKVRLGKAMRVAVPKAEIKVLGLKHNDFVQVTILKLKPAEGG